jgi:putative oxidoreductase
MTMFRKIVDTTSDPVLTILRLVLGAVFFAHGAQKMLGWFGGSGFTGTMGFFTRQMGIPAPLGFLAIATEFFGGLGLLVGLFSRIAAFGITTEMVVVVFMIHRHFGFFMNWGGNQKGEGFEYHLLAIALGLSIVVKGSGAFSIDRLLTGSRSPQATHVTRT